MSEKDFYKVIDKFRSSVAWQNVKGTWKLKDSVVNHADDEGVDAVRLKKEERCVFQVTKSKKATQENAYILLGRGWVDDWKK